MLRRDGVQPKHGVTTRRKKKFVHLNYRLRRAPIAVDDEEMQLGVFVGCLLDGWQPKPLVNNQNDLFMHFHLPSLAMGQVVRMDVIDKFYFRETFFWVVLNYFESVDNDINNIIQYILHIES